MAAPISAKSASWRAVAPILAPRSSTMQAARQGRPQPGDGRPLDARHGRQDELGHGHQGAGVAGRDHEVGLALLHGLERQPHAGAAAAAHRLARLVLHLHHGVGVDDARALGQARDAAARCGAMRASSPNSRKLTSGWRSSAMAAPGTTTAGPSSPPMASSDMVRGAAMTPHAHRCTACPAAPSGPDQAETAAPPKTTDHSRLRPRDNQIFGASGCRSAPARAHRRSRFALQSSSSWLDVGQDGKGAFGLARGARGSGCDEPDRASRRAFSGTDRCAAARHSKTTRPTAICPATIGSGSGSSSRSSSPPRGAGMSSSGQNVDVEGLLDRAVDGLERHDAGLADLGAKPAREAIAPTDRRHDGVRRSVRLAQATRSSARAILASSSGAASRSSDRPRSGMSWVACSQASSAVVLGLARHARLPASRSARGLRPGELARPGSAPPAARQVRLRTLRT